MPERFISVAPLTSKHFAALDRILRDNRVVNNVVIIGSFVVESLFTNR
ncbi:hypothetical protein PCIT_b0069 [Pseudoalteromonas citrea]|uniref:Uncharacterized protein n=1 Tax=Pseudoalteromonas citrea TaxID=43655 RepID=A0AAD4FPN3_9GAMM|nr:hypothetical protein PCIT_b0069 [Pseudoalteromonas citrea]